MYLYPAYTLSMVQTRLRMNLVEFSIKTGLNEFMLPVGLFLVLDTAAGGDDVAEEITKRFTLLDLESRDVIDFYFLGWAPPGHRTSQGTVVDCLTFDISAFSECRRALERMGIGQWGGNADLILVDAHFTPHDIILRLDQAVRVDLSRGLAEKEFSTLGGFLQSIIDAAAEVRREMCEAAGGGTRPRGGPPSAVWAISDKLGAAIGKESLLDWFLTKWGKIIGAKRLAAVTVRNLAPPCSLLALAEKIGADSYR